MSLRRRSQLPTMPSRNKQLTTQAGANDASGRAASIERTLPRRIHNIEIRQVTLGETMNARTGAINSKMEHVEQLLLCRPRKTQHVPPTHVPATPMPPIPPFCFGTSKLQRQGRSTSMLDLH